MELVLEDNLLALLKHIHEDVPVIFNRRICVEFTLRIEAEWNFKLRAAPWVAKHTLKLGQVLVKHLN